MYKRREDKKHKARKSQNGGTDPAKFKCDAFTKLSIDSEIGGGNTNKTMKTQNSNPSCAPGKEFEDGSCYTLPVIVEMVRAYNQANPSNKITDTKKGTEREYRKYLLGKLAKRLSTLCKDEICWLAQDFVKLMKPAERDEALNATHRPHGPGGQFKWLGTTNIDAVMQQYENVYPDFYFLGAVPADFDRLKDPGSRDVKYTGGSVPTNFDILRDAGSRNVKYTGFPAEYLQSLIEQGKQRFGIVFNTDESNQPGQHWISAYADMTTGVVAFFDSVATPPDPRIRALLARFEALFRENNVQPEYKENNTKFQYKNTECGVYSINFILRMIDNGNFDDIVANPIDDDTVNKCRVVYFGNRL